MSTITMKLTPGAAIVGHLYRRIRDHGDAAVYGLVHLYATEGLLPISAALFWSLQPPGSRPH